MRGRSTGILFLIRQRPQRHDSVSLAATITTDAATILPTVSIEAMPANDPAFRDCFVST